MKNYDHKKIEKKWQGEWEKSKIYKTLNNSKSKKMYVLDMFPYPSGVGLHVGHPRGYIGSDVYARMKRMEGYNVLHPMGYDAFGLPAEQYALQHKIHPKKAVEENVKTFEKQLSIIGLSYDWSRKVNTTDPKYYKWTQWIFLEIYNSWYDNGKGKARKIDELVSIFEKNGNSKISAVCSNDTKIFSAKEWNLFSKKEKHDVLMKYRLAYEGYSEVNWCEEMGTVLANDEIINNELGNPVSERGGYPVEKKLMRQWFMRITAYADRLLTGLDKLNWSDHIKEIQKNWIGKSEGSEIEFPIKNSLKNETKKILIGTRNEAKIRMIKECLPSLHGLEFISLNDIPEVDDSLLVEGMDYVANAKMKAEFYFKKTGIPTISTDNVFWLEKWKKDNGIMLHMRKEANPKSDKATDEEVLNFLKSWVKKVGGESRAHFIYAVAYASDKGTECFVSKQREYILQSNQSKKFWNGFPTESLLLDVKTKEYKGDQTNEVRYDVLIDDLAKHSKKWFLENSSLSIKVFTTRADTIFGATYVVLAPENSLVEKLKPEIQNWTEIEKYIKVIKNKTDEDRTKNDKEKTGVELKGIKAINPANGEEVPIWIADYVLVTYGTGAIMAVPQHDERDRDFAVKFGLLILDKSLVDSKEITDKVGGKMVTKYKMRDAIFARQRYWGEPIPLKHNQDGTISELKLKNLPLELPNVKSYESTGTGESPLAGVKSWVKEGYETNTMPGWAGSSWYFLRYMDPTNGKEFASKKAIDYWNEVDMYVGGAEHATGHLLYSRFWNNFLYDMGYVSFKEPFKKMKNIGMVLATDGRKMSKRWGNVINPDDIVSNYGADTLRVYEMFMGPFEQSLPWSTESIIGSRRFIDKVYRLQEKINDTKSNVELEKILHKTIKKVTEDIESMSFNTAISSMMVLVNEMEKAQSICEKDFKIFLQILAPFAPHITEEIWASLGEKKTIHKSNWPKWDKKKIVDETIKIAVQVNGKVRTEITVENDATEDEVKNIALKDKTIINWIEGKLVKRVIYVKGRIVNIVV